MFFHVYKNVPVGNGYEQQRLTNPNQITGYTLNDTILATTTSYQGVASSQFAFQIFTASANSGIIGGLYFTASINDPTPLTGIQSYAINAGGQNYVSPFAVISGNGIGASFTMNVNNGIISSINVVSFGSGYTQVPTISIFDSVSSTASGASITPILSTLNCGIFTGTSYPIGSAIIQLAPITIASISSVYPIDLPVLNSNFVGFASNTNYWAVFNMNTPYTITANQQLRFYQATGYSTNFATSNDGVHWSLSTTSVQIAKLGFVDQNSSGTVTSSRGVFLTNDQASIPLRLQLYVPYMDLSSLSYADFGPNAYINGIFQSSLPIQNSMTVYVTAYNSKTGITEVVYGNINQGTTRGTSILLGLSTQVYDQVLDVYIQPNISAGMNYVPNTNVINWTIYDLFTVDSKP